MGQIIGSAAKPKRCNANQLSQVPTPAAGEHILVSSENSMNAAGQGNFDAYIVGDGTTAATALPLNKINKEVYDYLETLYESSYEYSYTFSASGSRKALTTPIEAGMVIKSITGESLPAYVMLWAAQDTPAADGVQVRIDSLPFTAEGNYTYISGYRSGSPNLTITYEKKGENGVIQQIDKRVEQLSESLDEITPADSAPTEGSAKMVSSDGLFNRFKEIDGVQDTNTFNFTAGGSYSVLSTPINAGDVITSFVGNPMPPYIVLGRYSGDEGVQVRPENLPYTATETFDRVKAYNSSQPSVVLTFLSGEKGSLTELEERVEALEGGAGEYSLCCPNDFYAVVGKELNIYYDTLSNAGDNALGSPADVYIDFQCPDLQNGSSQIGVRRDRMWQIVGSLLTSSYIGDHSLMISMYDRKGNLLDRKTTTLHVVANASMATAKNILCIGDSLVNNGPIVKTFAEQFIGTAPNFIGQRTTRGYKHEGYPGYTFGSFASAGAENAYFIFDLPQGTSVALNDVYSVNSSQYTIKDIRTEGLNNEVRIRCTRSGSTTPPATGTLTKVSGASSSVSSVNYSAFESETGNPFWDSSTSSVNITAYRERLEVGKFDLVVIMLGTNDCIGAEKATMDSSVASAKTLIDAIISDAGNYGTKIILQMPPQDANTISSWQVYGDTLAYVKKITYAKNNFMLRQALYEEFTKSEYAGKVYLGEATLGIDRYYGFPYSTIQSSQRVEVDETYHTNSVHPNEVGYLQIGDGYYLQGVALLQ